MAHPKFSFSRFCEGIYEIKADEVLMHPLLFAEYIHWMTDVYPENRHWTRILDAEVGHNQSIPMDVIVFLNSGTGASLLVSVA